MKSCGPSRTTQRLCPSQEPLSRAHTATKLDDGGEQLMAQSHRARQLLPLHAGPNGDDQLAARVAHLVRTIQQINPRRVALPITMLHLTGIATT